MIFEILPTTNVKILRQDNFRKLFSGQHLEGAKFCSNIFGGFRAVSFEKRKLLHENKKQWITLPNFKPGQFYLTLSISGVSSLHYI